MFLVPAGVPVNLLSLNKSTEDKYVIYLMTVLFSVDELSNGWIIEDIGKNKSDREQLDPERVKLLRGIFICSFKL